MTRFTDVFTLSLVLIVFWNCVELAPTPLEIDSDELDEELDRLFNSTANEFVSAEVFPRLLRLSPAGANLTNYSIQWIPLGTVLFGNTIYYPPYG